MNTKLNYLLAGLFVIALVMTIPGCNKDDEGSNTAPIISSIVVNPSMVNAGATAGIVVVASDADGDQLTYSYVVSGGAVNGNGASASWTAPSQAGAYSVTVTVTDGNGGEASSNGSLTVSMTVTQITGTASFDAGSSGDLSNAKVSIYTSVNEWMNNNPIQFNAVSGTGANVSFTLTGMTPGAYYLDVWKDNDNNNFWSGGDYVGWYGSGGLGSESLTQFQIAEGQTVNLDIDMLIRPDDNNAPVITSVDVNPSTISIGGEAVVTVVASDADGDALTYLYEIVNEDGVVIGTHESNDPTAIKTVGTNPGVYTERVTVSDGRGGEDTGTATYTVIANQTQITGTASFAVSGLGDLTNAAVSIYKNLDDWANYNASQVVAVSGSGDNVTYTMTDVAPGSYYLDIWRDNDNDGLWSDGDFVGIYGSADFLDLTEFQIVEGETVTIPDIQMFIW